MPTKEILVNQLFAGRYLNEGNNIGHEVINLFRADDGANYIYITPSGRVKGHDIEDVIFVRNISARKTVEVVAVASGLSDVPSEDADEIRYGGVLLSQIFRSNTYHGGDDIFSENATFKAASVKVPSGSKRILLTVDDDMDLSDWDDSVQLDSTRNVIIPQGMRLYYSDENDPRAREQLAELIADEKLWEPADTDGLLVTDASSSIHAPTFLELIGKEDDELAFSNLLAHYFDYSHIAFTNFAANPQLLGIADMDAEFDIVRESNGNIDIWIESESESSESCGWF